MSVDEIVVGTVLLRSELLFVALTIVCSVSIVVVVRLLTLLKQDDTLGSFSDTFPTRHPIDGTELTMKELLEGT